MKKSRWLAIAVVILAGVAIAQEPPRPEMVVYGAYGVEETEGEVSFGTGVAFYNLGNMTGAFSTNVYVGECQDGVGSGLFELVDPVPFVESSAEVAVMPPHDAVLMCRYNDTGLPMCEGECPFMQIDGQNVQMDCVWDFDLQGGEFPVAVGDCICVPPSGVFSATFTATYDVVEGLPEYCLVYDVFPDTESFMDGQACAEVNEVWPMLGTDDEDDEIDFACPSGGTSAADRLEMQYQERNPEILGVRTHSSEDDNDRRGNSRRGRGVERRPPR